MNFSRLPGGEVIAEGLRDLGRRTRNVRELLRAIAVLKDRLEITSNSRRRRIGAT